RLDGREPQILYLARVKVHPYSLFQSRNPAQWQSVPFLSPCLEAVHRDGKAPLALAGEFCRQRRTAPPGPLNMLGLGLNLAGRFLKEICERHLGQYQYCICLKRKRKNQPVLDGLRHLVVPEYRFWADPLLYGENNR